MGAALVEMVCNLTIGKPAFAEHEARMTEARDRATVRRHQAVGLAAEDAEAFDAVIAAYRMPKETEDEAAARSARIQEALAGAADVPRRTAAAASEVLDLAERIVPGANPNVDLRRSRCGGRRARALSARRSSTSTRTAPRSPTRRCGPSSTRRALTIERDLARADAVVAAVRDADGRMTLLDGRPLAAEIRAAAAEEAASLSPVLAAVVATDDPATAWYAGSIAKAAERRPGSRCGESRLASHDEDGVLASARRARGRPGCRRDHLPHAAARRAHPRRGRRAHRAAPRTWTARARLSLGRLAAGLPRLRARDCPGGDRAPPPLGHRRSRAPMPSSSAARSSWASRSRSSCSPRTRP